MALFLMINIGFFYNLPAYTYEQAISVIQNELERKYENVESNLTVKNYFIAKRKYNSFVYTDYIIGFDVNGKKTLYLFNPYTGYYKEMK